MRLGELLKATQVLEASPSAPMEAEVAGLAYDSRQVGPESLFVAIPGTKADGHDFLPQAAQTGALAAVVERLMPPAGDMCQLRVADSRGALAALAAEFYGRPSRKMTVIGVTGTNGKTTVSYFLESLLGLHGPVGVMGTVNIRYAGRTLPAPVTTPQSLDMQAHLAGMLAAGTSQAVMEVSSHALSQNRADAVALDAGVFTNLSRDHLDYHQDLEDYFSAKESLFTELLPASKAMGKSALAVVGIDTEWGVRLAETARREGLKVLTFGFNHMADVRGLNPLLNLERGSLEIVWARGGLRASTPLVGRFNLENLLAAAAVGLGLGFDPDEIREGLESLTGVPGRLERVGQAEARPRVFVDYAHTPDALTQVLAALKSLCAGRLICVFGAGGDRDPGKRPLMGQAVAQGADLAVLTSDNPRTENPLAIMAAIESGLASSGAVRAASLPKAGTDAYVAEPDRAKAIALAVAGAKPEDVVLIAGKGHEDYQIVGTRKRHFDDREQAAEALAARLELAKGGSLA